MCRCPTGVEVNVIGQVQTGKSHQRTQDDWQGNVQEDAPQPN